MVSANLINRSSAIDADIKGMIGPFCKQVARLLATLAFALPSGQALAEHSIDRIVVFGTSLSDTGNGFILLSEPANESCGTRLNVPPYDALDELLIPDGPYAKGGHHWTDGATWVEGLARSFALAGNARPALQNTGTQASNYAVGGARAVADVPCDFNLPDQVTAYLADFPQTSANTLVAVEIGSNDVRDALAAAGAGQDPTPYIQNALASLAENIGRLYANGARDFLLVDVPDIGKTPAVRTLDLLVPGTAAGANQLSQAYNAGLAGVVQFVNGLPGASAKMLDIYTTVNNIIANPQAYGFANVTDACVTPNQAPFTCAKPDTYVFWDGIHPTEATHTIVAQQAIAAVSAP